VLKIKLCNIRIKELIIIMRKWHFDEKVMHDHVSHSRKRSIIYALLAIIAVRVCFPNLSLSVESHMVEESVIKRFIKCVYNNIIS
jgi:hypothetical protein